MTWKTLALIGLLCFCAAWLLTLGCRRLALSKQTVDVPNARSSHSVPTPTAGGWGLVIVTALGSLWLAQYELKFAWLSLVGLLVASVGFIDDKAHLHAGVRLLVHFTAGLIMVTVLSGLTTLWIFGRWVDLGVFGNLLAVVGVVWMINLYNFMDGINGIAASQAVVSCLVMFALLLIQVDIQTPVVVMHLIVAVAAAGFLCWNFPVAKIFLGDTGSGYLGLLVAILMLMSARVDPVYFWCWLIMLGVFVVDATYTLLRRWLGKEHLSQAHRSHTYQKAAQRFNSHSKVTLAVIGINLFWLAPLATLVALEWVDGAATMVVAYIPLFGVALWFGAGTPEHDLEVDN